MKQIIVFLVLLLGGCAASAQTPRAYVDVNALLPQHPLYGTLAQYDRQIAALEGTLHTGFANTDAAIANAQRAVESDATADAAAYRDALAKTASCCPKPPAPPAGNTGQNIAAQMTQTYDLQRAQVQGAAAGELQSYRTALQSQERQASSTFTDSLNERVQRAVDQRAQELREREANVALELARQHSAQRLQIRSKLATLVLRDDVRKSLLAQLAALQAQENAAIAQARRADAVTLQTYTAKVRAQAQAELGQMQSDLTQRSAANLAAREHVTAMQQSSSAASLPLSGMAAPSGKPTDLSSQIAALQRDALPGDGAFGSASNDLVSGWNDLRSANRDDTAHTQSQIDWLRHDREMVRKKMVAQIVYEAQQIADARGLQGVATQPVPGATDVTADVRQKLQALNSF